MDGVGKDLGLTDLNVASELRDILVVLIAAKVGAEISERISVPPVVGEIIAGILVGPSALGFVASNDVLTLLGQLGVILLLLSVGLEMDLAEIGAVGRASLAVATVGVVVPFFAGAGVGALFGMSTNQAIFVGAALTATSVGITARVFGDLHALASVEARTVLGAAVADDVMGLVILTVVVRVVTIGSLSLLSVLGVVAVAVGFLVVVGGLAVRLTPPLFSLIARTSRSSGTVIALALAFTLALAEVADKARLAPIVGAFVAGVAMSRSSASDRIRRDLVPIGHLFIPVFFLQIGIDARLGEFARPAVLGLAGALFVVAIVGKLASAAGLWRSPGDRLLVGIGMIPRGEVGLIFATLGLEQHIFGARVYAALLLVVLLSTLVPPPFLRWRLLHLASRPTSAGPSDPEPTGGWLQSQSALGAAVFDLAARPPVTAALSVALDAAARCDEARPGPQLLGWLAALPEGPLRWDRRSIEQFLALLRNGGPRSWRFLEVTGMLERALPELASSIARRRADASIVDPAGALRWAVVDRMRALGDAPDLSKEWRLLAYPERVWLAAVIVDATRDEPTPVAVARRVVLRLDLGAAAEEEVARLVGDTTLLPAAAARPDGLTDEAVLQVAAHLRSPEQARALYLLTLGLGECDRVERQRLDELHRLLQATLAHPALVGREASNLVSQRRAEATRLANRPVERWRIDTAPRHFVLSVSAAALARAVSLCDPRPGRGEVRLAIMPTSAQGHSEIDLAAADRQGLLGAEAQAFARCGIDIRRAVVATWPDGCAVGCFEANGSSPDADHLRGELQAAFRLPDRPPPPADVDIRFDDDASPWHTVLHVTATDRPGLLHAVSAALGLARVLVHSATISTADDVARDTFELTDSRGRKLDDAAKARVKKALVEGEDAPVLTFRARFRRGGSRSSAAGPSEP